MTQVDFYILGEASADARLRVACRIADKAVQLDQRVFVRAASAGEARQLDELLWTFADTSFVPHRIVGADADAGPAGPDGESGRVGAVAGPGRGPAPGAVEPVLIGIDAASAGAPSDLLINLGGDVPEDFSRFARVAEIVDSDPGRRREGRDRYKYYRDRGCELKTHEL
ncbi:MAG TPA: DNA polymerase III subunit chi [Gammaproteobacteria bacterium]|nr:DNA polymerase III subunit chi [Gammaproteobacteria bacterium]